MTDNKSLDDLLEEPRESLGSANRRSNGFASGEATDPDTAHQAERNPQNKFKPQRIDLTAEAPVNLGYVGGIRMPRKKSSAGI